MGNQNRGLLFLLGVLILLVLIAPLLGMGMAGSGMMGPGMMGPGMMGGPGTVGPGMPAGGGWAWGLAMGLGWLAMLAFWGAVIVGIVLLVRPLIGASAGPAAGAGDAALDILKRRYAAGEITKDEYEQMRQTLQQ